VVVQWEGENVEREKQVKEEERKGRRETAAGDSQQPPGRRERA
jgi:hypothetical protein